MTVAGAVNHWAAELAAAARSSLAIDWESEQAVVLEASASVDSLLRGDAVDSADLGADEAVIELLIRLDQRRRSTRMHSLAMVLGSVRLEGHDEHLPLASLALRAERQGRKAPSWKLQSLGSVAPGPLTHRLLRDDFGIQIGVPTDPSQVAPLLDGLEGTGGVVATDPRLGLVIQQSGWLDTLRDIESFPQIEDSALVAALSGDESARRALRAEPSGPPEHWVPPLPADSSQQIVVDRIASGETLVIEGPPGAGKSQTVANLIGESLARSHRVLFVAEKPAAVTVVQERLAEMSLAPFVANLHQSARIEPLPVQGRPDANVAPGPPDDQATDLDAHLARSETHHAAIEALLPFTASAITHGSVPVGCGDLDRSLLARRAGGLERAVGAIQRERTTQPHGVLPTVADWVWFADADRRSDLSRLVEILRSLPGRLTLADGVKAARACRALVDLAPMLDRAATVPGAVQQPASGLAPKVRGTPGADGVAERLGRELAMLAAADLLGEHESVGSVIDWSTDRAVPPGVDSSLLSRIVALPSDPIDMGDRPLAEVIDRLSGFLEALVRLDPLRDDLELLCQLENVDRLFDDADGVGVLRAALARRLATDERICRGETLAQLSTVAGAATTTAGQQRQVDIRRAGEGLANEDSSHAITVEGLLRRSGRSKAIDVSGSTEHVEAVIGRFPVVIASPWNVARLLPARPDLFDLVIFDEASQVETAAAVPALARSRSAAIFGDTFQLPPNRFFRTVAISPTDPVLGQASLLDAFAALLAGTTKSEMLRWHYRSQDERLISFVAESPWFYAGRLVVAPGPPGATSPVKLHVVEPGDVVATVVAELDSLPGGSDALVITFGVEQADSLADRVREAPAWPADRIRPDIRSIEQVQGDEADHVVLVLPEREEGTSVLQSLGPINLPGGERRLNVAITRARRSMSVVSTFAAGDLEAAPSDGARVIREFLTYIEQNQDHEAPPAHPAAADRALDAIAARLAAAGITARVRPRHSPASVRLVCESASGGPAVAVDVETVDTCALSAHDREVTRYQLLVDRGWRIARSGLADWILDPDNEVGRIRRMLQAEGPV